MTCDFGTAAPPIGSCVNVNKGSVELMRWLQTMEHVAPVCVWGLHGPGPRKSCSEVGEAPAELAELFPGASLVSEAAVSGEPVCVLGGHQFLLGRVCGGPESLRVSGQPPSPGQRQRAG